MMRHLAVALFVVLGALAIAPVAATAAERVQILRPTAGGPQLVVGPDRAERMTVKVRGTTRVSGRSQPLGASVLGHNATAVALPDDLHPGEPIVVRIDPAAAGSAKLVPQEAMLGAAIVAARAGGIMLGILFAAIVLQLGAFAVTREPSIPWYVAFVMVVGMGELARDGILPGAQNAPVATLLTFGLLVTFAATGLVATYLRLWSERRRLFWLLIAAAALSPIVNVLGLTVAPFTPVAASLHPSLMFLFAIAGCTVIIQRAKAFPPAWILLSGLFFLIAGAGYRVVRAQVGIPFLDRWGFEIAATSDALIFALAIMVRIRYVVAERRAIEGQLRRVTHEAEHDELTGVLNRRGLFARAEQLRGTLFSIDLDGFKAVNELYGHAAGDAALIAVTRALGALIGREDVVARTGGDEFVVIADVGLDEAAILAHRFAKALEAIRPSGSRTRVPAFTTSIGYVALDGLAFANALRLAGTQSHRVKSGRRQATSRQRIGNGSEAGSHE